MSPFATRHFVTFRLTICSNEDRKLIAEAAFFRVTRPCSIQSPTLLILTAKSLMQNVYPLLESPISFPGSLSLTRKLILGSVVKLSCALSLGQGDRRMQQTVLVSSRYQGTLQSHCRGERAEVDRPAWYATVSDACAAKT
jgi:hypothetical protein